MAATDFVDGRLNLQIADFSCFNYTGSAIAAGVVVKVDSSHVLGASQYGVAITPTTGTTDTPFGITVQAFAAAAGSQGNVQTIDGTAAWATTDASGAITAGTQVMPSATAGTVKAYAATGNGLVGVALSTTASTGDPILIMLQKRGPAT